MLRKRSTYLIGGAILVAFVAGFMMGSYFSEPTETIIPHEYFDQMALFTWKGWSGDLCFLLVPMIERGRAQHDFWSKWNGKCGVENMKKALSAVPKDKYVYWENWPRKFHYPSHEFCDEILEFAKTKGVHLELNPALDTDLFTDWQPH
jgi:hypothetical protein